MESKYNSSLKLLKELVIYISLLNTEKIYLFQINHISNTSNRSFERYIKELINSGSIPKTRLKSDENGLFLEIKDLINTNKKFYKFASAHSDKLARLQSIIYLKTVNHPFSADNKSLKEFYFKYLNPNASIRTFQRDLDTLKEAYICYNKISI